MKTAVFRFITGSMVLAVSLVASGAAQQDTGPVQGNAGQASQPAGVTSGPGNPASSPTATTTPAATKTERSAASAHTSSQSGTTAKPGATAENSEDNPYNPYVEPPPMPKGKATLIGGIATHVDHVRNRLTIQPFGKGQKIKVVLDERSRVYRDGAETTVLGIRKGDRVYADTMLDGAKIFAKNVRVVTHMGPAEVRGQVLSANRADGTISVQDELSSKPVTFAVSNATQYSAFRGTATSSDVRQGSLVDVQFAPDKTNRAVAQEIIVLAKPGDEYIFAGTVTSLDMRTGTLAVDNLSDEQNYEIHFDPATVSNIHDLKVGSEISTHAMFDGKMYKAADLRIEQPTASQPSGDQSKVQ
jgi:hypothetical protein